MKIFKEKDRKLKSWVLKLTDTEDFHGRPQLIAVDSHTGELICYFITFQENGDVYILRDAKEELQEHGYDPYEHNNKFHADGSLKTSYA